MQLFFNNIKLLILILFIKFHVHHARLFSNDPDIYADASELITLRGFKFESYSVTTEDDYILTIFRIVNPYIPRHKLKAKPVLMLHGPLASGTSWIINRKGWLNRNGVYSEDNNTVVNDCKTRLTSTLAFTLSACGYDVWLGNFRGNRYTKHVKLTKLDPKFWEFSLTEIGFYDIPATIEAVLQITTKASLSLIGVSLGNTVSFIMLSLRPELQNCVRPYIALSPVVFLKHTTSFLKTLAPLEPLFRFVTIGIGEPLFISQFIGELCGNSALSKLCTFIYGLIIGPDTLNIDPERVPVYIPNFLDYSSTRPFLQYAQFINSGRFASFDFGEHKNMIVYGQKESPSYPLRNITSKHIYLFSGLNDPFARPLDVKRLANTVPGIRTVRTNPWRFWNHDDCVVARYENKFQDGDVLKILGYYN